MTEQQNDNGGPAFPMGYHPEGKSADHQGMSHRDYLAAHAPKDICDEIMGHTATRASKFLGIKTAKYVPDIHYLVAYAKAAYVYADAMIAAGKEVKNGTA